jgi:kynurenine formamidase
VRGAVPDGGCRGLPARPGCAAVEEQALHTTLLGADIPVVEAYAGLEELPGGGFWFFAVLVKAKGFGSFPVRAFAVCP